MIEISHLSFAYPRQELLFSDINLKITQGGIYGLLGRNGSGKTTLLKVITGLIFPDQGECQVLNFIPRQRWPSFLEKIYFLPEDFFVPAITPASYVNFYAPFYQHFDRNLFRDYMKEFDLSDSKILTNFSYGQRKKFLIAFGLATGCQILILDEPTNGLDIPSKAQFRKLLAGKITDEKLFIISTHQVHDVENIIDSLVILDEGKILFHTNLHEISKRLAFLQQKNEPDPNTCFYYEKNLNGYTVVTANKLDEDTHVDLEILFNTVLTNKSKMQQLFTEVNL